MLTGEKSYKHSAGQFLHGWEIECPRYRGLLTIEVLITEVHHFLFQLAPLFSLHIPFLIPYSIPQG